MCVYIFCIYLLIYLFICSMYLSILYIFAKNHVETVYRPATNQG